MKSPTTDQLRGPAPEQPEPACCRAGWIVAGAISTYVLLLSAICFLKLRAFVYDDFDLSVHTQSLAAILRGSIASSILGIPFLGNHLTWILFPLAPLFWLFRSPAVLLILQSVVLGAAAWPLFELARRELSPGWGCLMALLYLIYPPLIYMNLYEFHPVALASGFLLFMLHTYRIGSFKAFLAWAILAMMCQENIPLIIAAMGIFAWVDGRRGRWIGVPLLAGMAYFLAAVALLLPHWNPGVVQFAGLYGAFGNTLPEVAWHLICHPLHAASVMLAPAKLQFMNQLMAPLAYVSLLGPAMWIPMLPVLLQRSLSGRVWESMLVFHYQAEFIPFLFVAAVYGVRRVLRWTSRPVARMGLAAAMIGLSLVSLAASDFIPHIWRNDVRPALADDPLDAGRRRLLASIPSAAPVLATFEFMPELAARAPRLYAFHQVYAGHYTLSTNRYELPEAVDYIALNTRDRMTFSGFYRGDSWQNVSAVLGTDDWTVLEFSSSLLGLRRGAGAPLLADLLREGEPPAGALTNVTASVQGTEGNIECRGVAAVRSEKDGFMDVDFYWRRLDGRPLDVNAFVVFRGADGRLLGQDVLAPGHRIRPPQSWPVGRTVRDRQRLLIQGELSDLEKGHLELVLIPATSY